MEKEYGKILDKSLSLSISICSVQNNDFYFFR